MWYRLKLAAADLGCLPIRADKTVLEGPCLEDAVAEAAMLIVTACDQSRPCDQRFMRMFLAAGLEIEQWTTQTDFLRHDGVVDGFRRAMRDCLTRSPSCSPT